MTLIPVLLPTRAESFLYLDLTGVDLLSAVLQLIHSEMVLRAAEALIFVLILLILSSLSRRVEHVRTETLQQSSYGLGLGQLGDLEVLLVVWCVFPDQTLFLCGKSRPLKILITPLTIFSILIVILFHTTDDGLLCKVHSRLEKRMRF